MNIALRFCLSLLLLSITIVARPTPTENPTDSIRISLLTCTPGNEIYALFGHTAIRYENLTQKQDIVFNYGIFSFQTPNFVWRFVKGETDYRLGAERYRTFRSNYEQEGRGIQQQALNLTTEEANNLYQLLLTNYQPENSVYRYNFLYDNCSSRARDKIEESLQLTGKRITYTEKESQKSFRNIIHEHCTNHKWDQFGMDFCLGSKADKLISYREEMFAPFYLLRAIDDAKIEDSTGIQRNLVDSKQILLEPTQKPANENPFSPMRIFLLLFILTTAATIYGIKKKKSLWGIDLLLFAIAGAGGSVVFLLSFFSEHPAVSPNFLIFAFHPLHLLFLPFVLYKEAKGRRSRYHQLNLLVLTLFILLWPAIPQYFNPAVLPLALCLLIRSMSNIILTPKRRT